MVVSSSSKRAPSEVRVGEHRPGLDRLPHREAASDLVAGPRRIGVWAADARRELIFMLSPMG
jgi:hypothetical protein